MNSEPTHLSYAYPCRYCFCCIKQATVTRGDESNFTEYPLKPWCYPLYAPLCALCSINYMITACWIPCCLNTGCTDCCMLNCYDDLLGKECFWNLDKASQNSSLPPEDFCCECNCVRYRDDLCCCLNFKLQSSTMEE